MDKFLIIDGSSMLTTNYHALLPKEIMYAKTDEEKMLHFHKIMQTSSGVYTNAIYGTLKTLYKILKNQKPTHLAVVFDQTRNTFRRELYGEYKGTRKPTQQPLKEQFVMIEQLLPRIGIPVLFDSRYEADDFAGSLVRKFEGPDTRIYVMTKDHDYLQLVSPYTRCWMVQSEKEKYVKLVEKYYTPYGMNIEDVNLPDKVFEFTEQLVKEEFGLYPSQIIDMKAICGDSSDNIPGIRGVAKAAIPLLVEYGTVENLYDVIHSIDLKDKKAIKELNDFWKELGISRSPLNALIKESHDELVGEKAAILSKQLATIKCDIPINKELRDFVTNVNIDEFKKVCNELEITSIFKD